MNKEEVKYKAIKKVGYGECFSDNINYIIENVDRWCGPVFDLYVDGVKVDNPKQYLEDHKPKEPQTLEEKIVDMCYKIDYLKEENKQLKEKIKTYEEPEDMTLMYMWCNEKAKDKIKQLKEVIEEVREYINNLGTQDGMLKDYKIDRFIKEDLLQILDKVKGNK